MKNFFIVASLFLFSTTTVFGQENESEAIFARANEKLDQGDATTAVLDYTRLINSKYEDSQVLVKRAIAYYRLGKIQDAAKDLETAYRAQNRSAALLGYRGMIRYQQKDFQGASSDLDKAFTAGFQLGEAAYFSGNAKFQLKLYKDAIAAYNKAESLSFQEVVLFNNRGKARAMLHELQEAIADYTKTLALDPAYSKALLNRAEAYYEGKNWQQSVVDFSAAIEKEKFSADQYAMAGIAGARARSDNSQVTEWLIEAFKRGCDWKELNQYLAGAYQKDGKYDKALSYYQQAVKDFPENHDILKGLTISSFKEKQYKQTVTYADLVLRSAPGEMDLQSMKGLSYYFNGQKEEALATLMHVRPTDEYSQVYIVLGELYLEQKSYDLSIENYSNALEKDPEKTDVLLPRAQAYVALAKWSQAEADLSRILESNSQDKATLTLRASVYYNLKDYEKASSDIQQLLSLGASDEATLLMAGKLDFLNKDYKNAILHLNKIIDKTTDYQVHALLGSAYFQQDNFAEAEKYLKIAMDHQILTIEGIRDLGIASYQGKLYEAAVLQLTEAEKGGETSIEINRYRGLAAYEAGQLELSRKDLKKVADQGAATQIEWVILGHLAYKSNEFPEAIDYYSKSIAAGANEPTVYLSRGLAYEAQEKHTPAIADFSHILESDQDHDKARFARGKAYFLTASYQNATTDLLLVNNNAKNLEVNEMLGEAFFRMNPAQKELALKYLEQSITLGTEKGQLFLYAGQLHAEAKSWEECISRMNMAGQRGVKEEVLFNTRGQAYFYSQKYQEALKDLLQFGSDKVLIGLSYYNLGNYSEAIPPLNEMRSQLTTDQLSVLGDAYYQEKKFDEAGKVFDKLIAKGVKDAAVFRHRGMVFLASAQYEPARADFTQSLAIEPNDQETLFQLGSLNYATKRYKSTIDALYQLEEGSTFSELAYLKGMSWYYLEKYDQATPFLEEARQKNVQKADLYEALGHLSAKAEEWDQVIIAINHAHELGSEEGAGYYLLGAAHFAREEYAAALVPMETALSKGIDSGEAYFQTGVAHYETDALDKAIDRLSTAIEKSVNEGYYYRGNAYYKKEDYIHAISDYEAASAAGSTDPILYNNLGKAYANVDQIDKAIAAYDRAIQLDANYVRAYQNRGEANFTNKTFEQAVNDLKKVEELSEETIPGNSFLLAESYYELEEYRKSITYFNEALKNGMDDADTYHQRGKAFAAIDDFESALPDFNQAVTKGKKDAGLYIDRANANIRLENERAAVSDLNEAINLDQGNADAYYNRGYLQELNENYNEAISDYIKVIELTPEDDAAYYSLANSYVSQGNLNAAIDPINKALEINAEEARYYMVKGNIYHRLEQDDKACDLWKKAAGMGEKKSAYYHGQYCE